MKRLAAFIALLTISITTIPSYATESKIDAEPKVETKQSSFVTMDSTRTVDIISTLKTKNKSLEGEKIVCMGDSITKGAGGIMLLPDEYAGWPFYLAQKSGAEVINLGIGGSPISHWLGNYPVVDRMEMIPEDATKIIFFAGINDFLQTAVINDEYKTDTEICFEYLAEHFKNEDVYIVTTYKNGGEYWGVPEGSGFSAFMDYQIELAEKYNFNVIDLYNNDILDQTNEDNKKYFSDDIHPGDLGYQFLGKYFFYKIVETEKELELEKKDTENIIG